MEGVDNLLNLVTLVKSDGLDGAFTEDVLYGNPRSEQLSFKPYPEPLQSLRKSLEDAKIAMVALNTLKTHLAKKIRNLQRRSGPLVLEDGIKRTPDEVLAYIFEIGHHMSTCSKFSLLVSHVSHRFRQLSLRTPLLWTRLSSEAPKRQNETFISRSGYLDVEVALSGLSGGPRSVNKLKSFLQLTGPLSGRWSRLLILNDGAVRDIFKELGLSNFPRLQYIYHENGRKVRDVHLDWKIPLLSQFEGYYSGFLKGELLPFLSKLTRIKLSFSNDFDFNVASLAQVLYRSSNLQDLTLEFQDCQLARSQSIDSGTEPHPDPLHLELMKIVIKGSIDYKFTASLYDSLAYLTASVVDMTLLMSGDPYDFLVDGRGDGFPYGQTIRLQMSDPCSLTKILHRLLLDCTIIESIQFDKSSFNDKRMVPSSWKHYPSLRNLRFRNCAMLDGKQLEVLAMNLLYEHEYNKFESLEIISCDNVSEEYLLDLQVKVGEGLKWSI